MKSVWPRRSIRRSTASGSLTLTMSSAFSKMSPALATIVAPLELESRVGETGSEPRAFFDQHTVTVLRELRDR